MWKARLINLIFARKLLSSATIFVTCWLVVLQNCLSQSSSDRITPYYLRYSEIDSEGRVFPSEVANDVNPREAFSIGGKYQDAILAPIEPTSPGSSSVLSKKNYSIGHWDKSDGLPDQNIRDLLESQDGYIWIATTYGLARFDGHDFRVFDESNQQAFREAGQICVSLVEHPDGSIWIGVDNGLIRKVGARFERIPGIDERVRALQVDQHGGVWIATESKISVWRNGILKTHILDASLPVFRSFLQDTDGNIWFGSSGWLGRFAPNSYELSFLANLKCGIYALLETTDNRILIGTSSWGILEYTGDKGNPKRMPLPVDPIGDSHHASFLFRDHFDRVWAGLYHHGLLCLNGNRWQSVDFGLPSKSIRCMLQSCDGSYWFGSRDRGLYRVRERPVTMVTLEQPEVFRLGRAAVESADGSMWLATHGGLIHLRDNDISAFYVSPLYGNDLRAFAEDSTSSLWFNFPQGGLALLPSISSTSNNGLLSHNVFPQNRHESLAKPLEINCLTFTSAGDSWVGTAKGLYRIRGSDLQRFLTTDGLAGNSIFAVVEMPNDELWIATNKGISIRHTGRFKNITQSDGLPGDQVRCILRSTAVTDRIWVGTSNGLAVVNGGEIKAITKHHGLPDPWIRQILEDEFGDLWIQCSLGIYRLRIEDVISVCEGTEKTVRPRLFSESDGLSSLACEEGFQNQACRTQNGKLWFATHGGFAIIDPSQIHDNLAPPKVSIDLILAGGIKIYDQGSPLLEGARSTHDSAAQIPPSQSSIVELVYSVRSFTESSTAPVQYKLVGFDNSWNDGSGDRKARYTNIPPGEYKFLLKAANHDGYWSLNPASLSITVLPSFHQTGWFYLFCAVTVLCVIVVVFLVRRRFETQRRDLAVATARVEMARNLHSNLGAAITSLSRTIEQEEQETKSSPLSEKIRQQVAHVQSSHRSSIWAAHPDDDSLERTAEFIAESCTALFKDTKIRYSLDLPDSFPDIKIPGSDRHLLFTSINEAVQNLIKHSKASKAGLRVEILDHSAVFTIEDNGVGLPTDVESALLNRRAGHHGLSDMKKSMESIGGAFSLHSNPGEGTVVTLSIPVTSL